MAGRIHAVCVVSGAVLLATFMCGCGGSKQLSDEQTAPFQVAIQAYLGAKSMDLKVYGFKRLEVDGSSAEADVSLEHAGGMVGPKVRWTFWFERRNGSWVATRHEQ